MTSPDARKATRSARGTVEAVRLTAVPDRPDVATGRVVPLRHAGPGPEVTAHLDLVDGLLTEVLADLRHLWTTKLEGSTRADVLGDEDLPHLLDGPDPQRRQADPAGDGLPRLVERRAAGPVASVMPRWCGSAPRWSCCTCSRSCTTT